MKSWNYHLKVEKLYISYLFELRNMFEFNPVHVCKDDIVLWLAFNRCWGCGLILINADRIVVLHTLLSLLIVILKKSISHVLPLIYGQAKNFNADCNSNFVGVFSKTQRFWVLSHEPSWRNNYKGNKCNQNLNSLKEASISNNQIHQKINFEMTNG